MHLDVQDLRNFYYRSTLGRAAQAAIRGRLIDLWPEAKGQTYRLPAGSFFELKDGKISRVTTYYNLADWVRQVS